MADPLDYGNRPSKDVARRMFIDLLRRLSAFQKLDKYSYVGFGAIQFIDFDQVHRQLGIKTMVSIEADETLIERCKFNAPFKGIKIHPGTSTTILPSLDWSSPSIVWLDYTQRLRGEELSDIENLALTLQPGSVLAVTLNCQVSDVIDERRDQLSAAVGEDRVPLAVSNERLGGWGLAAVQRDIVTNHLAKTFASRGDGAVWQQLLNIWYKDGASMQLLAGVVDRPDIHERVLACRFEDVDYVRDGAESLTIKVPLLTPRERMTLSKSLPGKPSKSLAGIPVEKLRAYAEMYRWMDSAV